MDATEALVGRLPAQAPQIRRRYWRDPEFRAVCDDLQAASLKLAELERERPPDPVRLAEYRGLLHELLDEARRMLATGA